MNLPDHLVKQIISINLQNPKILRYMKNHHIEMAQIRQKMLNEMRSKNIYHRNHPIYDDIRKYENKRPIEIILLQLLHTQGYIDVIVNYLKDEYIKNSFYIISHLGYVDYENHFYSIYITKKGKNNAYIVIYKETEDVLLFYSEELGNRKVVGIQHYIYS